MPNDLTNKIENNRRALFLCVYKNTLFHCFLQVLLQHNSHTALCKFKEYSIIIWVTYTIQWCLVNIHNPRKKNKKHFFFVMRTPRIHSLNNFDIYACVCVCVCVCVAVLIISIMVYITSLVFIFQLEVCIYWLSSFNSTSLTCHFL